MRDRFRSTHDRQPRCATLHDLKIYLDTLAPANMLKVVVRELTMPASELRKLVLGAPQVLGLDFETEVAPKIAALEARVGSLEAAKAEALRQPSSLELPVIGSKGGAQERGG